MISIGPLFLILTGVSNIALGLFVLFRNARTHANVLFSCFVFSMALWSTTILLFLHASNEVTAVYYMKGAYVSALFVGLSYYLFAQEFPSRRRAPRLWIRWATISATVVLALYLLLPGTLVTGIVEDTQKYFRQDEFDFLVFAFAFVYLFVGGLITTWIAYFASTLHPQKTQLLYVAVSVTFAGAAGMYYNLFLPSPYLAEFTYIWTGPLFTFFISMMISYAMFRHRLFNIKLALAELMTFALLVILIIRLIIRESVSVFWMDITFLVFAIVLSILIMRSVQKEVSTAQELKQLTKYLSHANARLRVLDKQKTEFVSIASHQLRSPIAAVSGYTSLILEGSYGNIPERLKVPIARIYESSRGLAVMVDDFLNVTRIEQGRMKYANSTFELGSLVEQVIAEVQLLAAQKKLTLTSKSAGRKPITVKGDEGKTKQVVTNVIDNAVKYTQKGTITIELTLEKRVARVTVSDTGIGISPETQAQLFQKFSRAENANSVNVHGTGLGLYIAREMMRAQGGDITVSSPGVDKGSIFVVTVPLHDTSGVSGGESSS